MKCYLYDGQSVAGGAYLDLPGLLWQWPLLQGGGLSRGHLHPPHRTQELVLHAHVRVPVLQKDMRVKIKKIIIINISFSQPDIICEIP